MELFSHVSIIGGSAATAVEIVGAGFVLIASERAKKAFGVVLMVLGVAAFFVDIHTTVDRTPEPYVTPPPQYRIGSITELQQRALEFASDFEKAGSSSLEDAKAFFSAHYAPEVRYFDSGVESAKDALAEKVKYMIGRTRSYNLLPGAKADCDEVRQTCVVTGMAKFRVTSKRGTGCGMATLLLGLEFASGQPLITSEQGEAHLESC